MKSEDLIEVLYTDACPFWKESLKVINQVLKEREIRVALKKTKIRNEEEARLQKVPGSPTIRINGVDIDPQAKETMGYIGCRVYMFKGRIYEFPPKEMIESALERLLKK